MPEYNASKFRFIKSSRRGNQLEESVFLYDTHKHYETFPIGNMREENIAKWFPACKLKQESKENLRKLRIVYIIVFRCY